MPEGAFGHYRLLSLLGQGGMGEVWRALDERKDRQVALKILGTWLGAQDDYTRRFRREAATAARLNAQNIVPIHDYGEIDGRLFIEMPLIDGTDLHALLDQEGALPPARAVGIIDQVAVALDIAHEAGLVHRDVKPSNVLITPRAERDFVYLIDFGIARPIDGTLISQDGTLLGTPAYMAPERFTGHSDHRGDIYALACMLCTALTGRPPFEPPSDSLMFGYAFAHLHSPTPHPSELNPAIPPALDEVVSRGMAKDPDDRYATAGELAVAARAALAATPDLTGSTDPAPASSPIARADVTEQPTVRATNDATERITPSPGGVGQDPSAPEAGLGSDRQHAATDVVRVVSAAPTEPHFDPAPNSVPTPPMGQEPVVRPSHRRRNLSILGALLAVAVVAAVVVGVPKIVNASTTNPPPPPPISELQLTSKYGYVYAVATAQLNGRPVVITGNSDNSVGIWDMATGTIVDTPITGHSGWVDAVTTAQLDGRTVVISGSRDGTIRLWDLASHDPIGATVTGYTDTVAAVTTAELNGQTVIVAGDSHVFGDPENGGSAGHAIRVWDLKTRNPISTFASRAGSVLALTTARIDDRTVVITGNGDNTARVRDLATGDQLGAPLDGHAAPVSAVTTAQLNGRTLIVTGSRDGTVRLWDLVTHAPVNAQLDGQTGAVTAVTSAELDGRPVIIAGGANGSIEVWDLATRTPVGPALKGHDDAVEAMTVTHLNDRTFLISGSRDRTVRIWDLSTRFHR